MFLRTLRQDEVKLPVSIPVMLAAVAGGFLLGVKIVGWFSVIAPGTDGSYAIPSVLFGAGIIMACVLVALLIGITVYARMVWRMRVWRDRTRAGRMLVG